MILAQINAPEWAPLAVKLASIVAISAALVTLIIYYRRNGGR